MSHDQIRQDVAQGIEQLKTLRDEIRLKVKLAELDLRSEWEKLEPKLSKLELDLQREGDKALAATKELTSEIGDAFRSFRKRLS